MLIFLTATASVLCQAAVLLDYCAIDFSLFLFRFRGWHRAKIAGGNHFILSNLPFPGANLVSGKADAQFLVASDKTGDVQVGAALEDYPTVQNTN